jgi:Pyruvate/2-oxoacid:ferredoxin oxidoreductase gamma subunit
MKRGRPDLSDFYANSIRRDAWRAQLLHEQVAEEAAARRRAQAMRNAVMFGFALGVAGCFMAYIYPAL